MIARLVAAALIVGGAGSVTIIDKPLTDGAIKREMIRHSLEVYVGECPCDYSVADDGGDRATKPRPNGQEPLCRAADVTAEMLAAFAQNSKRSRSTTYFARLVLCAAGLGFAIAGQQ